MASAAARAGPGRMREEVDLIALRRPIGRPGVDHGKARILIVDDDLEGGGGRRLTRAIARPDIAGTHGAAGPGAGGAERGIGIIHHELARGVFQIIGAFIAGAAGGRRPGPRAGYPRTAVIQNNRTIGLVNASAN